MQVLPSHFSLVASPLSSPPPSSSLGLTNSVMTIALATVLYHTLLTIAKTQWCLLKPLLGANAGSTRHVVTWTSDCWNLCFQLISCKKLSQCKVRFLTCQNVLYEKGLMRLPHPPFTMTHLHSSLVWTLVFRSHVISWMKITCAYSRCDSWFYVQYITLLCNVPTAAQSRQKQHHEYKVANVPVTRLLRSNSQRRKGYKEISKRQGSMVKVGDSAHNKCFPCDSPIAASWNSGKEKASGFCFFVVIVVLKKLTWHYTLWFCDVSVQPWRVVTVQGT